MTFERVFESRPNRLVMVGIFLAMLELIRDKLVWAEQGENSHQIYLRALTEEPAEEAVRRAIMAVDEAESTAAPQPESAHSPPIPIVELPAKTQSHAPEGQGLEEGPATADDDFVFDGP